MLSISRFLSFIIIPPSILALVFLLYLLLRRHEKDAISLLQYEITHMLAAVKKLKPYGKDMKKLSHRMSKLEITLDKAAFEDLYDLAPCRADLLYAKQIIGALSYLDAPEEESDYLRVAADALKKASDYIAYYCGVKTGRRSNKLSFDALDKNAKKAKAKSFLKKLK